MRALWQRVQSNVEFGLPQGQSSCTRGENAARVRNLRQRVPAPILFEIARRVQAWDKVSTSGRCADRNQRSERHKKVGRRRDGIDERFLIRPSIDGNPSIFLFLRPMNATWMPDDCFSPFPTFLPFLCSSPSSSLNRSSLLFESSPIFLLLFFFYLLVVLDGPDWNFYYTFSYTWISNRLLGANLSGRWWFETRWSYIMDRIGAD